MYYYVTVRAVFHAKLPQYKNVKDTVNAIKKTYPHELSLQLDPNFIYGKQTEFEYNVRIVMYNVKDLDISEVGRDIALFGKRIVEISNKTDSICVKTVVSLW